MTNNPAKIHAIGKEGTLVTGRIPVEIMATNFTRQHLLAKKMAGHLLTQFL